jgi:hypothetical protein
LRISRVFLLDLLAGAAVVAAVVLASYWKIVDCETYMRLAIGRATAAAGGFLRTDPFLYSIPGQQWRNGEWLGDLILWWTYRVGGEAGLVALKLVVLGGGWLMLYILARKRGGSPIVIVSLVLVALGGSEWRLTERDDMFAHCLIPAYGLALEAARRDRRWLWALAPLGVLWANVHGSFTIGWVLVGAALAEALFGADRDPARARALALALALHPLLPLASPEGPRAYSHLVEHLLHAGPIKRYIREWQPPEREAATLAQLPLHVLGLVGLASFLPRPNRRQVQGFLCFAVGLVFAYGSQRFLLLFALLAIPAVAGNLRRAAEASARLRWPARAATAALAALGVLVLAPAVKAARSCPHAADQPDYPAHAARFIAAHAPGGSRLFMPYTGSQWVMWLAPEVGLSIHPHFSFRTEHMLRFFRDILPNPARFEEEVRRFDVNLALVDLVGESRALHAHLDAAADWQLVYFDGFYALYARKVPRNEGLLAEAFHTLRARLGFDYLTGPPGAELDRLTEQGPAVASALRAYLLLRAPGDAHARGLEARALLTPALAALPSSPALSAYLVEANLLAGDRTAAAAALQSGLRLFPQSSRLRALAAPRP